MGVAGRIIPNTNTLPILSNVLLKTENGVLKISSTNLEISITTFVRCKVEEEGEACVPAKTLTELVNNLPNSNLTLTSKNGTLSIENSQYHTSLKTLPSDEFPKLPHVEGVVALEIPSGDMKDILQLVLFAAAVSETQAEISGILLRNSEKDTRFVATDRYRLAEYKLPASAKNIRDVILPIKACQELFRIISGVNNSVQLIINENQVLASIEGTEITARLVDGQYPEYEQIVPDTFSTHLTVDRSQLLGALKTSGIFSAGTNTVRLEYKSDQGHAVVGAVSQDVGESSVVVPGDISGPSGVVLFNYRYLQDVLTALSSPTVELKLNSDSGPVVITDPGRSNYLYLVMPIKS